MAGLGWLPESEGARAYFRVTDSPGRDALAEERGCESSDTESGGRRGERVGSTGIGRCGSGQAEPKQVNELRGRAGVMPAATQITQAVQPLDGQRQARE